nr:ribonuclease H-like domain-containing protein [Tanacetum cinerariifolium]
MAGEDTSQPPPPPLIASTEAPQMVSSVKLPILKKVILNGNSAVQMTKDEAGNEVEVPLVTAHQKLVRIRERKVKSTMLMAILDEHLARFYGIKDAKTLWAAIITRFGGNAKSKKMQKNVLKKQFEIFSISNSKGLDKGYDRFQRLLRLLEIHGKAPAALMNLMLLIVFLLLHAIVLRHKDLEKIDQDDLEEMDLKWQGLEIIQEFRNRSRDVGNAGYRGRNNGKRPAKEEDENTLVVQDGLGTYY